MARPSTNDAAQTIIAAEMKNLNSLLQTVIAFDQSLVSILDEIDYPENFPSESRRIARDIRSMIAMRLNDIPMLLASLAGAPSTPIAPSA